MEVIKITPRGYCHGVVDAIQLAKQVARDPNVPRPIYILGQIVHNRHVVEEMSRLGIITLDGESRLALLEKIEPPATVIFTAHGVSPQVRIRAKEKGLHVVDATCPDVTRTHELIRELAAQGYEIFYIGKRNHPEPEGALGVAPGKVHLIETPEDLDRVRPGTDKLAVTTQTTMSIWDTQHLIDLIRQRYPQVQVYNEICLATQLRQEAVAKQAPAADLVIVVGDSRSNNSKRLVQVAREIAGREAYLVDSVADIKLEWLRGKKRVAVTSGASTPTTITREVIRFLEELNLEVEDQTGAAEGGAGSTGGTSDTGPAVG
ncbi:MAG: 4-hydroxy-3-methylbut-2-enyl diphosphate reductase [Firmicutes bacterium]|nr:4-hydroxy-3-methylbut-2-enyl diphosphate reductase [Bacillota bacterium]